MKLKHTSLVVGAASLLPFVLAPAALADDAKSGAKPFVITISADADPVSHSAFRYPSYAGARGIEGSCEVSFAISPAGRTDAIRVGACTSDVFRIAAKRTVAGMTFAPGAAAIDGVRATINWALDDGAPALETASID